MSLSFKIIVEWASSPFSLFKFSSAKWLTGFVVADIERAINTSSTDKDSSFCFKISSFNFKTGSSMCGDINGISSFIPEISFKAFKIQAAGDDINFDFLPVTIFPPPSSIAKISEFTFEKYRNDLEELAKKKDPQEVYDFFQEKTKEQYKKLFDLDKFKEVYKKAEEETKSLREELFKLNMDYMNFVEPSSKEDVKDLNNQIVKMSNKIDSLNKEIERLKSK